MHVKKNSIESYKRNRKAIEWRKENSSSKYMAWNLKHYSKANTDELRLLLPELNKNERIVLFSLLPYVGYDDCLLKHMNGKSLNIESIANISVLSVSTTEKTVNSLRTKNILYKEKINKNVQYYINPWICSRGSKLDKTLKMKFKDYKIQIYQGIKWEDLEE